MFVVTNIASDQTVDVSPVPWRVARVQPNQGQRLRVTVAGGLPGAIDASAGFSSTFTGHTPLALLRAGSACRTARPSLCSHVVQDDD